MMWAILIVQVLGSLASIAGLCLSIYIWRREVILQTDMTAFKTEGEQWHDEGHKYRVLHP
jgi:uncharacterized protein involved in tolerance to divalent cations